MVMIYGHRGAAGEAPENTLAGLAYAWSRGVRHFEFDIHLMRWGVDAITSDVPSFVFQHLGIAPGTA